MPDFFQDNAASDRTAERRKRIAGLTESGLQLYGREKQFVMNFTMFIKYTHNIKIQSDSYLK